METESVNSLLTSNKKICSQLLTEAQCDHQERITVAEPFKCIQREILLSKSERADPPKQENYLHETLHVGKSNIILMGILLGYQKPNFLHRKTFLETPLKLDNYPELYHTITFPDFGFRTQLIFTYI